MTIEEISNIKTGVLFDVYSRFDLTLTQSKGVHVFDIEGYKYLDMYGGHGVISIGHSQPYYTGMVRDQLTSLGYYSNSVHIPLQQELATKLARVSGYPTHQLFLCNSGAEANENALKLASFHTGKNKIIAFKGSFHGRTSAALNVTDNIHLSAPINQNNFEVEFVELNDVDQLKNAFAGNDVCAVIVEGIQGVGGLDAPTKAFLQLISDQCNKHGALLILDEIQSGYGRTGQFFAHQYCNVQADIISMAKGMGNGFPIAGILIHPTIQSKHGLLGTTFGGNHLACAAGIAVLDVMDEEQLLKNVLQVSEYLIKELSVVSQIKKIKGRGLMMGLEFDFPIAELRVQLLNEYRIITGGSANPNLLRILPPLCISTEEVDVFVRAIKDIFNQRNNIKHTSLH